MDGYSAAVFIFLAYVVGQITYFVIPSVPIMILAAASSVAFSAILLWHWTQFSVEYRTSTWQEGLRNYASYFLVFLVVLLSYGFYVFSANGGSLTEVAQKAQTNIRNTGRDALNSSSRILSSISEAIQPTPKTNTNVNAGGIFPSFSSGSPPTPSPAQNLFPKNSLSKTNVGF